MTEWIDDAQRRIARYEGIRYLRYYDTRGVPTIGVGFNLERSDARVALLRSGVAPRDIEGVLTGKIALTTPEVENLFAYSWAPIVSEARASLAPGIFDALTDARRFVICDLAWNLGEAGWATFDNTRAAIAAAQEAKDRNAPNAHVLFAEAASQLALSLWYQQTGDRAVEDCAMLRSGVYVPTVV